MKIDRISIRGYKSIRELDGFELRNLNVLIGANGAGQSNFISVFRLLASMAQENLQQYVQQQGGPDSFLFRGRKHSTEIEMDLSFGVNGYQAKLQPTADNRLIFEREVVSFQGRDHATPFTEALGSAHDETKLKTNSRISQHLTNPPYNKVLYGTIATDLIGLPRIEAECAHFSAWLTSLRALAP